MSCTSACIFAGPSLPVEDRASVPGVVYLPPARRGDVDAASRAYDAVLLIDGVFHHDLAPSPKEVLAALGRVPVFGAASMGALRAAECALYGMVPLGIIARWYASGVIDGDDEVAVLVDPASQAALTVPSVNVRYVAWLGQRRGLLTGYEAEAWIEAARTRIFYMDRSWPGVLELAPSHAHAALKTLAVRYGDLKRWDARFALRRFLGAAAQRAQPGA